MSLERIERAAATCTDPEARRFLVGALRKLRAGLPADQALELCSSSAKAERNRLLRLAAALLPGTATERARELEAISDRLRRAPAQTDAERLVALAAQCCRVPKVRQLFEIIADMPDETASGSG